MTTFLTDDGRKLVDPEQAVGAFCAAVQAAILYRVFAEEAAYEGEPDSEDFYRNLQNQVEEEAAHWREALIHALGRTAVIGTRVHSE